MLDRYEEKRDFSVAINVLFSTMDTGLAMAKDSVAVT